MFRQVSHYAFQRRNLLCFLQHPSLFRFVSTDFTTHQKSYTISYLINSCGLSQQRAISASKKLQFESSTNPDSVLTLLRNNGFSDSQISKAITQRPGLLLYNGDKTLKPKFDFFNSKGFCGDDLAKVISREPSVLTCSLDKVLIPSFDFLKRIIGTDEEVRAVLKRSMDVTQRIKTVVFNIAILRAHGVPMSNIRKFLVSHPRVMLRGASRFSENVEQVKKMKFDPSKYVFLVAIRVLDAVSKSSLGAKIDVYKSCGWSEHEVQCAFQKHPSCMALSKENIMSTMDIFVNKFGYAPSSVAEQPVVLDFSCERRIIPRCTVIQFLVNNGKLEHSTTLSSFLQLREDQFLKYISRFEKEVPELLRVYTKEKAASS